MQFKICLFFLLTCLFACEQNNVVSNRVLPDSSGDTDEIIFVADKNELPQYKPLIKQTFAASYDVLPQFEPIFQTSFVPYDKMNHLIKRFRNLVMIADLSQANSISKLTGDILGEENVIRALNDQDFFYIVKKDVWARPQQVIFVFGADIHSLSNILSESAAPIIKKIQQYELTRFKSNAYASGINSAITSKVGSMFNVTLSVPEDYVIAIENENFLWLRKETDESSSSIMLSSLPTSEIENNMKMGVMMRNTIGKEYISTHIKGSYMISDTILPFIHQYQNLNSINAIETRGLWKIQNDFMGGPFLNYYFIDSIAQRAIMLDGFIHAPKLKKKSLIRNLEAIFSTIEIDQS